MTRRTTNLIVGLLSLVIGTLVIRPQLAFAALAYWDVNGTTAGAGVPSAGTWDSLTSNWTSNSAGTSATTTWVAGNTAVFAAGNDATGTYSVTLSGTQNVAGLTLEEGSVTLTGGTALNFTSTPTVSIASGTSLTIASVITGAGSSLTKTGSGTLTLSNTGNNYAGSTIVNGAGSLKLGASGVIPDSSVVTMAIAGSIFDLNGFNETVKSISGSAGTIAVGSSGKLTLDNPAGETYTSVFTGTAGSQIIKNGSGALTLSGGSSGFSGEFVLNNGTIGVGGTGIFGSNAAGPQLTINGGNLSNNSASTRSMSANLSVNLNGNFTVDDSLAPTVGQILFNGASAIRNSDRTITVNGTASLGFAGAVGQDVAGRRLTKDGNGVLTLSGPNTYGTAGVTSTTVNAGKLVVNNTTGSGTGPGNVTVNSGGTLGGTGTIEGTVTNNGRVAPGNSAGTVTAGNYTQTNSGVLEMEVAGTTTGTFDKLNVTGTASLDGILRIVNQTTIAPGTTIQLLTANSIAPGTQFDSVETIGGNGIYFAPTYSGNLVEATSYSRGDMNRDGDRDSEDVKWFALALTDPDAYEAGNAYFEGGPTRINIEGSWSGNMNDMNGLDFDDIALFAMEAHVNGAMVMDAINRLSGVPEPDSRALMALGILGAAAFAYRRGARLPTIPTRSLAT